MRPAHASSEAGFTLVEVLTVLFIIGLMTSAVFLTRPSSKAPETVFAERLVKEMNGAAQMSLITGQPVAMNLSKTDYALSRFDGDGWRPEQTGVWPTRINFEREGRKVELKDEAVPLVVFEPTGGATVFSLHIQGDEQDYRLVSTGNGRVTLERVQ